MGAFVGDALALGAHWMYDPAALRKACGPMTDLRDPLPDSYHPNKRAGDQSHVGDQSLVLLRSLAASRRSFDLEDFTRRWRDLWPDYQDYLDHATKHTLEHGEAAASEELAGPARIAPLMVALAEERREDLFDAVTAQTALTHQGVLLRSATWFIAELTRTVMETNSIGESLDRLTRVDFPELPFSDWLAKVRAMPADDPIGAVGELGRACPTPQALPSILYLLVHHGHDLEHALVQNTLAGGDNCVRGLVLGTILGAAHGLDAIPERWRAALAAHDELVAFCG